MLDFVPLPLYSALRCKVKLMETRIFRSAVAIIKLDCCCISFSAQRNTASIVGTVADPAAPLTRFLRRFGFAYDLGGKGRTVLRGGYGMSGNIAIFNSQFLSALNPPFVLRRTYQADPSANVNLSLFDDALCGKG